MSHKLQCHKNRNITQAGMSLINWSVTKIKWSLKWNVTKSGISLEVECHSKLNVTKIGMPLKLKCKSNLKISYIVMLLKYECCQNWSFN